MKSSPPSSRKRREKQERVRLRVRRRDGRGGLPYWDEFEVRSAPRMTLAEALDAVALLPVTLRGERVAPVAYTWGCSGSGCGSCTVVAAGRPVVACATLLSQVTARGRVELEPLAKLGVVRDLLTHGTRLRDAEARLAAAADPRAYRDALDAGSDEDGDRHDDDDAERAAAPAFRDAALAFALARCTRCGACIEACPETRPPSAEGTEGFAGAAAVAASALWDLHPSGDAARTARHRRSTEPGGIHECGLAQNCLEVCPEGLPLDEVLALAFRNARGVFWRR